MPSGWRLSAANPVFVIISVTVLAIVLIIGPANVPVIGVVNSWGATMQLSSPVFQPQADIPQKYTCDGEDISPPLQWAGLPQGTQSLVLIVDDPDAPDPAAPKMTWVHWVLFNLPATNASLPEGVSTDALPAGTKEGLNDWKRTGYGGPCPPIGRHRYFFKLYALDIQLPDAIGPDKARLENAMQGHVLEKAVLVGTYQRPH